MSLILEIISSRSELSNEIGNSVRAFVMYVIHRKVASVLVAVNSCDVLAYNKRLFDVTLVI